MAVLGALGDLVLALSADTAKFQSDLGRADRMAKKFGQEMGKVLGNVAGLLVGIGGSAGFTALVKGQIDAADSAGKMAQKTGASTEALSSYMVAARLADVSNEQLQGGLQKLAKAQADYVAGIGDAAAAFEAMGISQKQVKDLNGDTAAIFDLVVGKLAQYEDGANKTALAMKIFGKSGAELIPLINSLEETRALAKELGLVMDKETAAASERFNDNMTTVGLSVQALGLGVAKVLLPTLDALSARLVDTAKDAEGVGKAAAVANTGLKLLVTGGTIVATVFKLIGERLGAFAASAAFLLKGDLRNAMQVQADSANDMGETVRGAVTSILETWDSTATQSAARAPALGKKLAAPALANEKETKDALARAKKALDLYIQGMSAEQKALDEIAQARADVNREDDEATKRRIEQSDGIRRQLQPMIEMREELEQIQKLMAVGTAGGGLSQQEGEAALAAISARWRDAAYEAVGYNKVANEANDIAKELGLTFSSAFEDAIVDGKKLSEVLKALGQDILRLVTRKTVTEPLAKAGSGLLEKVVGSFFPASGGGSSFAPGALPFGMSFADGGEPPLGRISLVGERGPELFVPNTAGTIVPNHALGGSSTVIYNIDARGAEVGVEARILRVLNQVAGPGVTERRALSAVRESSRR